MVALSPLAGAGWQFFDNNGVPLAGGKLYTYAAGTTTPAATYTSSSGATPHANPIILDSAGRIPEEIWLTKTSSYKFVLATASDIILWTKDDIIGLMSSSATASDIPFTPYKNISSTNVQAAIQEEVDDLGAASGASLVGYSQGGTGSVARTVQDSLRDVVSVKDFGATGDGVTDDAAAIQKAFDYADTNLVPSVFFPTVTENYLVQTPVSLTQPGVLVYGAKGPSYNRGNGKKGNILVGASATHGLDLGDGSASTVNPADMWSVSNLGFLQAAGTTTKTKRGIALTRQNNGPDRGVILSEISAVGMEAGVYVPPPGAGVVTQIAGLVIENSCLSENKYGVWAEGHVYGLRFVGNQAEQNNNGVSPLTPGSLQGSAVKGDFQGAITINDNMLEGQPNPVSISATLGAMQFESKGNYFENNRVINPATGAVGSVSDYIYSLATNGTYLRSTAVIGPNFYSGVQFPNNTDSGTIPAKDMVRITGKGSWALQMNDPYPVTFYNWAGSLLNGSDIFPDRIDYYRVRQINMAVKTPEIFVANGLARYDTAGAWTHVKYAAGTQMDTPLGVQYTQPATTATSIGSGGTPFAVAINDLIVVNIMVLVKNRSITGYTAGQVPIYADIQMNIYNSGGVYKLGLGETYSDQISDGVWCLISIPFVSSFADATGFQFKYVNIAGTMDAYIAGVSAKNYGPYVNDGTAVAEIAPVAPKFN